MSGSNSATQGGKAAGNGMTLESVITSILDSKGFEETDQIFRDDECHKKYERNFVYETCYTQFGAKTRSELAFYYRDFGLVRIECKWQQTGGSVDEKFPFMLENAKIENEDVVIFVIDGGGYRMAALEWLKEACEVETVKSDKPILCMNITEFVTWANTEIA